MAGGEGLLNIVIADDELNIIELIQHTLTCMKLDEELRSLLDAEAFSWDSNKKGNRHDFSQ